MDIEIKRLSSQQMIPFISDLAELRVKIFYEYPYLCEGDLEYEKNYLTSYTQFSESIFVLVFDDNKLVGASTATPLKNETDEIKLPFLANNWDLNKIFYVSEGILLPKYRGHKIGLNFSRQVEEAIREKGIYETITFSVVDRQPDDPRRPIDWNPPDRFWEGLSFTKHRELKTFFKWKEIGESEASPKPMIFWLKQL